MVQATLSPELTRQSIALARALSSASRNWGLYPPEHPAVDASVKRLAEAINRSMAGAVFTFGVTPKTLMVAGYPLPEEQSVTDAARLMHDHDILQLTFVGEPNMATLHALLALLQRPADELRAGGGPAKVWQETRQATVALEQIDYEKILEDRNVDHALEHRDDIWRSLVNSIVEGHHAFDSRQQQRLLEIAGSAFDINELATAVAAPKCSADGSPLITTQAATVLATFRHLAGIVTVMDPDRLPDVMRNVAAATTTLDPHVVMQIMQTDEGLPETPILCKIAQSFDDDKVADLLATALSRDGKATARIRSIMGEQGNPAFNQTLLRRFVNLMGLFPIGTIVRLSTEEIGVVTAEHPEDPFRPQVKILFDSGGARLESELLVNTWERDSRGAFRRAVVESVDDDSIELDPLTVL